MNQRLKIAPSFEGSGGRRQLTAQIDLTILERLELASRKFGHGSKKIIIEDALTEYLNKLEKK